MQQIIETCYDMSSMLDTENNNSESDEMEAAKKSGLFGREDFKWAQYMITHLKSE